MNILIPHSWLKEYLITNASPEKIAQTLSLCGPSVERLNKVGNDYVYDIEITTNRIDMMSVLGIAREAAAILPQFNIKAKFSPPNLPDLTPPSNPLTITITDTHHTCRRILGIVLDNVKLKASNNQVKTRLEAVNIRSLNNAVDITNYVMTEIGHPTHVFDYDRIKTKKLVLRRSKKGEKIVSLENKQYTLPGGDNVIDDGTANIIDLPGIIGTKNSIVIDSTKRVLFFLETNDPLQIRKTSMTLGIRTQAATLNEKWVDPELAITALKRGVQLLKELTGATIASKVHDIYPNPIKPKSVKAPLRLIKNRLGIDINHSEVSHILKSLGFENQYEKSTDRFTINVPTFRHKDINIPEDIVEEVARIYGYHKLPSKLMATPIPTNYPDENFELEHKIKIWLADMGLNELYTNSMVSKKLVNLSGLPANKHLKIKNALSEDWQYLRLSLTPSHLKAIQNNSTSKSVSFFEIANTYHQKNNHLPNEKLELIISTTKPYPHLKGILETLFSKLHLKVDFKPSGQKADIFHKKELLGTVGPSKENSDIFIANFDLKPILKLASSYPKYQPISSHPPIIEDLTFTLAPKTYLASVITAIQSSHKLITKVGLVKTYQQNFTFNLTYQSQDKPLTDKLIAPIRKKVVQTIKTRFKAKLVGKI